MAKHSRYRTSKGRPQPLSRLRTIETRAQKTLLRRLKAACGNDCTIEVSKAEHVRGRRREGYIVDFYEPVLGPKGGMPGLFTWLDRRPAPLRIPANTEYLFRDHFYNRS